jgi:hypothetical protein
MKKINEMTKKEFIEAWEKAENGELVAENIRKNYSSEDGGFFYAANAGDCDGWETMQYWFSDDADDKMYVAEIDARI